MLSPELRTNAGKLLLDRYGELIDLSASGQVAMRRMFKEHLDRVEWDAHKFPIRLYPVVSGDVVTAERPVSIDPALAFGRPVLVAGGITTGAIAERLDAGETVDELAADYDLTPSEIEEAVLYERPASPRSTARL